MKILIDKTEWSVFWNTPYRVMLLADSKEQLDEIYNWCEDRYGKSQTGNILTMWFKKWRWRNFDGTDIDMPADLVKNTIGLYFKTENELTEFKLRWL